MVKDGDIQKNTELKHFENGVYEQCINADNNNHNDNDNNNNNNDNDIHIVDIDINHGNEIEDDAFI